MAHRAPIVRNHMLDKGTGPSTQDVMVVVGSTDWFAWLDTAEMFSVDAPEGKFTARKRRRGNKWYWYAHRRHHGQTFITYLGKSADLTPERLDTVSLTLARKGAPLPAGPSDMPLVPPDRRTASRRQKARANSDISGLHLIPTKFAVPHRRAPLLEREHATRLLDQALQYPLTVLSAPAGFGKTTLLTQWIAASRPRVAWVTLDQGDNDPMWFWRYVLAAFDHLGLVMLAEMLPLMSVAPTNVSDTVLSSLVVALAAAPGPTVLVLDDYHALRAETTSIHEAVAYLVEHLPAQAHIVLASRTDPPLPLARFRARGLLFELRRANLRLSPDEVARFLTQTMGLDLSPEQITLIETRTEGWIAALHLAARSLHASQDAAAWVAAFSGSNRYIFDFLVDEVLAALPPTQQRFLLETSVLQRLTASLCDAVTQSTSSQSMLAEMERSNQLLAPLDAQRLWYQYHPMFADALRLHLQRTQPDLVPLLHRRAARWCEAHKLWAEAIDYAMAATDFEHAAQLVEMCAQRALASGMRATLQGWLDQLPEAIVRTRPRLCAISAQVLLIAGHYDAFQQRLRDAEAASQHALYTTSVTERATLRGELLALRASATSFQGDLDQCITLSQQALAMLPEGHALRDLIMMNQGIASWLLGDIVAATRTFEHLMRQSTYDDNVYYMCASVTYLAHMWMLQGRLREAMALCHQTLAYLEERHLVNEGTGIHLELGRALYQLNDLSAAQEHLKYAIAVKRAILSLISGYPTLASIAQAQGDSAAALWWMQQALTQVSGIGPGAHIWSMSLQAHQAHLWVAQGNPQAASAWAREYERLEEEQRAYVRRSPPLVRVWERVVLAKVYVAENRAQDALPLLAELLASAEAGGRIAHVLEILVLQAVAYAALEETSTAIAVLRRAIELASPEGYIRVFLDGGMPVRRLLERSRTSGELTTPIQDRTLAYVETLLAAFADADARRGRTDQADTGVRAQPGAGSAQIPQSLPAPVPALTKREMEVLSLIARGASSDDLVRELVIATSTVKRHISNILAKLGVQRQTQAIAQAYRLGLLSPFNSENGSPPMQPNTT
jgi:LuxR family maltose regulon positive regulatory protein